MINKNKPVLVTGADGFIGSHLTELLLAKGYKVRALAQYNSFNDWGWLDTLPANANLEVVNGNVCDPGLCRDIAQGCGTIMHLAALVAIPYSYAAPDSYVNTNVGGTLNICKAARDAGADRLIVTSTSEVYGTAKYVPIDEGHPRQPQSPYSATKIGADAIAMSFHNAFGTPVVLARPFNTFGPRQSARAIIPTIITQIAAGQRTIKVGDLRPTRDFNYVGDTARGFLALAEAEADKVVGRDFNICSGREVTMQQTLETIAKLMNADVDYVTDPARLRPADSEVFRLCGDNTRIRESIGWQPRWDLESGLRATIDWFVKPENLARYKTDIYNV